MFAKALAFAMVAQSIPVVDEGQPYCATLEPEVPGQYYVRLTATNSAGEESGLSVPLLKQLPDDVCWRNPDGNTDESVLTDLVLITFYYDSEPIEVISPIPEPPELWINASVPCNGVCESVVAIPGETGVPIMLEWLDVDAPYAVRVYEWPDGETPITANITTTPNYLWTPTKAGVYYATVEGATLGPGAPSHLYFIKLAAPTQGGID